MLDGPRIRQTFAALLALTALGLDGRGGVEPARSVPARRDPDLSAQRDLCFPPAEATTAKAHRAPGVILWTDAPVDGRALVRHLAETERYLRQLVAASRPVTSSAPASSAPTTGPVERPVAVALYAARSDYDALWRRVGAHYAGRFGEIATEGFSYRVFCATYRGRAKEFTQRRSVLCHEFAHVWLFQRHGLSNDGNWLTEGLANAVQLHFFPAAGNRKDFARWMEAGRMLPLKRLMDLDRIAPKDYWQAATLIETIARHHPGRLPAVIGAHNRGDSAYAIVRNVLGTDFLTLQDRWAKYVRTHPQRRPVRPDARAKSRTRRLTPADSKAKPHPKPPE